MKNTIILSTVAAGAMLCSSVIMADNHETDDYMLRMTKIDVKIGHMTKFREAMAAYNECYAENDGQGAWSVWNNVTGGGDYYHLVSRMDTYSVMDETDPATMACWSVVEEQLAPHIIDVDTSIAERMGPWSGENQDVGVVELHHFRVSDNSDFREAVGAITAILKDAEYEHMGVWFEFQHNSSNEPDYFIVDSYENFAAMDEERAGAYDTVVAAAGQERADELWAAFRASLTDDWAYRNEVLSRVESLAMTQDD